MTQLKVLRRDGAEEGIDAAPGELLMEVLREANTGIEGTCGGAMSCGTCHVYVSDDWLRHLPPRSEDEQAMLDAIGDFVEIRPNSRLSCQIRCSEKLSGLIVEVAPAI